MTSHPLPIIACLALGAADLVFIDAWILPRVVGEERTDGVAGRTFGRLGEEAPTPPPDVRGGGRLGGGPSSIPNVTSPPPIPSPPPAPAEEPAPEPEPAPAVAAPPAPALALTIHFNTGEASLNPRARAAIDALVARVAGHPGWRLSVEGHADARGDEAINERLSQDRAQAVSARLEKLGLTAERVQSAAFGSTRPLSPNDDPAALRRNRRVEVLIVRGEP